MDSAKHVNRYEAARLRPERGLKRHFSELQTAVSRLLTERLSVLLSEVDVIEQDSVRPLDDCQKLIEHGVNTADELLREGEV
ncbi:cytokine receptor-like factor 3 [Oncorhynchus masou masou]|uniref:cytokine receptor-like factor 3 n=1 Tax=Oncorhynchus masou masou TaxID=90313 RepID=UPI003183A601